MKKKEMKGKKLRMDYRGWGGGGEGEREKERER